MRGAFFTAHQSFLRRLTPLLLALGVLFTFGCAQEVGDIDRTQPNKTKKTDLEGTWYMLQTVTDVPTTAAVDFIGDTSELEKVVWVIEENWLLAYRSYPHFPGADDMDGGFDYDHPDYHEAPVAAFPILSHFDIQRDYNAQTGEQSNTISENTTDRPWYERDYIRVDWSQNQITNFNLLTEWWWYTPIELGYTIDEERDNQRGIYTEREGEELVYFDVPSRLLVSPDLWGCAFSWWGWGTEDCTAAEIEVVTSFAKTADRRDYEPLPYDDQMMNRFGYFRAERYTFDPQRGVLESGIQKYISRHNIWQESYVKDAEGNFATDADDRLIPIPIEDREVRTVPYYMSTTFPDDPLISAAAVDVIDEWNQIFRESVAIAQNKAVSEVDDVFVLCHSPVTEDDHTACGEPGFSPRPGDLRYSALWWVESEQQAGPLGYGPSAIDPETGEIISGKAHVYAGGFNTWAAYALDVIRFSNGDLEAEDLVNASHVIEAVMERADETVSLDEVAPEAKDIPVGAWREKERDRLMKREERRREPRHFDRTAALAKVEKARELGLTTEVRSDEFHNALAKRLGSSLDELTPEDLTEYDPISMLNPTRLNSQHRRRLNAMSHSCDFLDLVDPNVVGLAKTYAGNDDYDQIWRELRAMLFKATAIHEVGHTLGLRHNFSGSYDSLNYFDEYWNLRRENINDPETLHDLYELNALTENQIDGRMREYQYSSIMDYGLSFYADLHGAGKYDRAAIVFGYTGGSTSIAMSELEGDCSGSGRVVDPNKADHCLVRKQGFVEVFNKNAGELEDAGELLTSKDEFGFFLDDPLSLVTPYLERYHYTTVIRSFPSFSDAFDRDWQRLEDFIQARADADGIEASPVRVPYLFCTDEWVGALLSCNLWDGGADPFEAVQNVANDYHAYYYFRDFKRDRLGWDPYYSFVSYYYLFMRLSDYYQNWYLAPWGFDDTQDDYYWMAVNSAVNIFAEVFATPEYGTYCTKPDGQLYFLSDDPAVDPQARTLDYYMDAYCDPDAPFYQVKQGDGRRRFTRYDLDAGYNFGNYPQETGHVWTSMAAMLALVDPEAFVIGAEGDVGTYAISFLDYFDAEIFTLVNAVLTEDYAVHSPVMQIDPEAEIDGRSTGTLHYPVISGIWDPDRSIMIDPATGQAMTEILGPSRARTGVCEPCSQNTDCNGYTGSYGNGGAFCLTFEGEEQGYCILDCWQMEAGFCGDSYTCGEGDWCLPESGVCAGATQECSESFPHGSCPAGETCEDGVCTQLWPIVETNTSLSNVDDIAFWGMLYSTFGWETRYNDQLNVFKMGTAEEITPGEGFERVTFTDPILGDSYGAIREDCSAGVSGGSQGLCSPCEAMEDCVGYTGYIGGTYCQPLVEESDPTWYCLQDCTDDPGLCPRDTTCDSATGNCIPDALSCDGLTHECSESFPTGDCEAGYTCLEGTCTEVKQNSARCQLGWSTAPGGAQLVVRGQELVSAYQESAMAWATYDQSDEDEDTRLYRLMARDEFAIDWLMMELNSIRAVYAWFGKVY